MEATDTLSLAAKPIIAISTIAVILASYGLSRFKRRISPNIPYAGEGSISERLQVPVEYAKDPVEFLRKTRQQLGDVFAVDLFVVKFVFFLGPQNTRTILRAPEDELSFWDQVEWALGPRLAKSESNICRSEFIYGILLSHCHGNTSRTVYLTGTLSDFHMPGWQAPALKQLRANLSTPRILTDYSNACSGLADQHFTQWAEQESVPLFHSMALMMLSHLLLMFMGEKFFSRHAQELVPLMAEFERKMLDPSLRILPWSLWRLSSAGHFILNLYDRFDELVSAEARDIIDNPSVNKDRNDFFYNVVSEFGNEFMPAYGAHVISITFAGLANMALSVPWLFLHARRTPGALDRMREESNQPLRERKYTEACLRETGRLYTTTTVARLTRGNVTVAGHSLPPKTFVACSPTAWQRVDAQDGGTFVDAGRWIPERFLADGAYAAWFNNAEFVQFGIGPHACPGERLAKMVMMENVLQTWFQGYDVEVVGGLEEGKGVDGVGKEPAWTEENFGTPSVRGGDVFVRVRRRHL